MVFVVDGGALGVAARGRRPPRRAREGRPRGDGRRARAARRRTRGPWASARPRRRHGPRALPPGPDWALSRQHHPWAFSLKRRLMHHSRRRASAASSARLAGPPGDERAGGRPAPTPSWSGAARPTAATCAAWPPSTTSTRWRSGGSSTSGSYAECAPGRTLLVEGDAAGGLLPHDQRRGGEGDRPRRPARSASALAGPGRLVRLRGPHRGPAVARHRDHQGALPAPCAAPRPVRAPLHRGGRASAGVFLDVIQRDIMATLRQTLPPVGRLPGLQPVLA